MWYYSVSDIFEDRLLGISDTHFVGISCKNDGEGGEDFSLVQVSIIPSIETSKDYVEITEELISDLKSLVSNLKDNGVVLIECDLIFNVKRRKIVKDTIKSLNSIDKYLNKKIFGIDLIFNKVK